MSSALLALALAAALQSTDAPAAPPAPAQAPRPPAPPSPLVENRAKTLPDAKPAYPTQTRAPVARTEAAYQVAEVAKGLVNPWGLAFLPDGQILVTERPGRVRLVSADGKLSEPLTGVPAVAARGIAGLFDVKLDPAFASNRAVYLSFHEQRNDIVGVSIFRGVLKADGSGFDDGKVIFRAAPGVAKGGDMGGRMLFDRKGALVLAIGEEGMGADVLQALDNDLGKVVRIDVNGAPAKDNPRVSAAKPEIYAYGMRDPQGLALDSKGRIWAMDHGPLGGDAIKLVQPGRNYGWPLIAYGLGNDKKPVGDGATSKPGIEQPVYYWDPAIGASGLAIYDGRLFPAWRDNLLGAALAGKHVTRLVVKNDKVVAEERLFTEVNERIRQVAVGPDGAVYLLTDSAQGRILRVTPKG
jgi:glucose/arabinose dehydrogenase